MKLIKTAARLALSVAYVLISAVNKLLQRRWAGTVFRTASALMFITMAIELFPAAGEAPASFAVVPGNAAAPKDEAQGRALCIQVIYRDNAGSEWALSAARELAAELADRYNCEAELIPASRYESGQLPDSGGAIVIGHTGLSECNYVDSYYSVGPDGCSTYFNSRGDLIIEAFGSKGAEAGIDHFLSNYNGDAENAVSVQNGLHIPDLDAALSDFANGAIINSETAQVVEINSPGVTADGGEFRTLVLASPDDGQYTIRAIEAILDAEKPDLVVFCGDLSAGKDSRSSLAGAWEKITAPLNARGISWSFLAKADGAEEDSSLPASMINEVLTARRGCISAADGSTFIAVTDSEGVPHGGLWLVGKSTDTAELRAELEESSALMSSAYGKTVPGVMVSDGALEGAAELLSSGSSELIRTKVEGEITGLYDAAVAAGISCFVSSGAPENTGVVSDGSISCAAAGSVGFEGKGLGGRFEYNNSLRGGVLITLKYADGESTFAAKYVYTADLGVNQR